MVSARKKSSRKFRVLLWTQHPACLKTVQTLLGKCREPSYVISPIQSLAELQEKLQAAPRHLLLFEVAQAIPETLKMLQNIRRKYFNIPIIILSHKLNNPLIQDLAKHNVQDILPLKELTPLQCSKAIQLAFNTFQIFNRAKRLEQVAQDANRTKTEFLTNVSHEIRIPLNGIMGMVGLLLNTSITGMQREYAESIRRSGDALLMLSNDILDFHKIEAGKLSIEPISIDLRTTIEELIDLLAIRAEEKGLELIVRYPGDVPSKVIGDPGRIRQILTNLIGNAIKFTEKGYVLIEVQSEEVTNETAPLTIRIKDTGPGIPEDQRDTIFEKYVQLSSPVIQRQEGTGLGLAITKRLVQLMGGSIGIESIPGEGSTFWFQLDLPIEAQDNESLPRADLSNVRILIVDANKMNRRVLHEQMAFWGIESDSCDSGEEALEKLQQAKLEKAPYHIAIIEWELTDMQGTEIGSRIKMSQALKNTVLVMLTSIGHQGDARLARESGFAAYLVKPIRQSILHDALSSVWGAWTQKIETELITRHTLAESRRAQPTVKTLEQMKFHAKILVAEDRAMNQRVARMILEELGCHVDVVDNGVSVLKLLAAVDYDAILMDFRMPRLDGFATTKKIRLGEMGVRKPKVPIIALTAHAMEGDREECLAAGMDDYLHKPIRIEELQEVLAKWLPSKIVQQPKEHPQPTTPEKIVDFSVLDRLKRFRRKEGPDPLVEMIDCFLKEMPHDLEQLQSFYKAKNFKRLEDIAHGLKSSAANVGAILISSLAKEIELGCRQEQRNKLPEILQNIQEACETSRKMLLSFKESDSA